MRDRILACVLAVLTTFGGPPCRAADSLYDDLGGKQGVARIGADSISAYMADPRLAQYFDDINPDWLKPHMVVFLCHVSGGPCAYHGRSMAAAHRGLHIDQAAFDALVEDLQATLRRAGVSFWTQNRLLARLAPMERDIVTR